MRISDWSSDVCSSDLSAFSIFRPMLGGDVKVRLGEDLRWLASELGDARNLDVLLERARPGALHDRIEVARQAAYDRVEGVLARSEERAVGKGGGSTWRSRWSPVH